MNNHMRRVAAVLASLVILTGCSSAPKPPSCDQWRAKFTQVENEAAKWVELRATRSLTAEEETQAFDVIDTYTKLTQFMKDAGCALP